MYVCVCTCTRTDTSDALVPGQATKTTCRVTVVVVASPVFFCTPIVCSLRVGQAKKDESAPPKNDVLSLRLSVYLGGTAHDDARHHIIILVVCIL